MKKSTRILLPMICTIVFWAISFYVFLPAINGRSMEFYVWLGIGLVIFGLLYTGTHATTTGPAAMKVFIPVIAIIVICIIGGISSATIFHASAYASLLDINEETDKSAIPTVDAASSIALMDTASAQKLGDREVGSLSSVVSQFEVSSEYIQLNYQNAPVKVAPLSYASFWKYNKNKSEGVPGYVVVSPVSMDADYVALDKGMKYVPSAYFAKDLYRHIRFAYPTAIIYGYHFEIDEEGNPYYVAVTSSPTIGLFGGEDVTGVIVIDPVTGDMNRYSMEEIPDWVDFVADGNMICEQYDNYGMLQGGFWNSVFSQTGCKRVTQYSTNDDEDSSYYSDYGYIAKDNDIWIYTGVTSVNSDSSNIGFLMVNERTKEALFIPASGADEFSAMAAAEGEIQEKGYIASFPSLININNMPTYIMVLKDDSGLVKMYAAVNVEQYNIVVTASSQDECINNYIATMGGEVTDSDDSTGDDSYKELTITVTHRENIDIDGDTYLYISDENGNIYHAKYSKVLDMILVNIGDTITIQVKDDAFRYEK